MKRLLFMQMIRLDKENSSTSLSAESEARVGWNSLAHETPRKQTATKGLQRIVFLVFHLETSSKRKAASTFEQICSKLYFQVCLC